MPLPSFENNGCTLTIGILLTISAIATGGPFGAFIFPVILILGYLFKQKEEN